MPKVPKKKKVKEKKLFGLYVSIDVYDSGVLALYGDQELAVQFCKIKGYNPSEFLINNKASISGFTMGHINKLPTCAYVGENLKNYTTITHELTHAILNITNQFFLLLDDAPQNQEHTAYLFGYVMGRVLEAKKSSWSTFDFEKKRWI